MALDQFTPAQPHDGQDFHAHEFAVPFVEHFARVARQPLQLKVEKLVNIEGAVLVLLVERIVARLVHLAVEHALLGQELRPLKVAVAAQQGVVEIE